MPPASMLLPYAAIANSHVEHLVLCLQDLVCSPRPAAFLNEDGSARVFVSQETSELTSSAQVR